MYLRVTVNAIARGKAEELRAVIAEMNRHREAHGYTPIEWLMSLTGRPDEFITVQRYERLADYEDALGQIAEDPTYQALLGRLKSCTAPGTGTIQLLRSL